jgi:small-conductance mechanosensitive channel
MILPQSRINLLQLNPIMKFTRQIPRQGIKKIWLFIALLGLISLQCGYGQEAGPLEPAVAVKDSTHPVEIIPFNEVLIASGESRIRAIRMAEALIPPARIEGENQRNDSILVLIDSALAQAKDSDYSQKSQRFLVNEKNYWQIAEKHVKSQKKRLSDLIRTLQDQHATIQEDLLVWKNTERHKDSAYAFGNISEVIATTTGQLDSLTTEINQRTELLIAPLNKTIRTEVELELLLEKIEQALDQKTTLVFSKTSPALFEMDGSKQAGGGIYERVRATLKSEWNALLFYITRQKNTFVVYLLFLVLVLVLFSWISTRLRLLRADSLSYYQNTFRSILQRPLSAGILFGLFFTLVFFPNRPPLLVDLTILALLIPLLDIFLKLTPGSVHRYLGGFAVLLLALLGIQMLPEETMLYRYSLMGLGIAELLILFRLYRRPELVTLPSATLTRFARFLIAFHLLAVLVGLAANVLGYDSFSQVAITSFITNILVGLLLYVCAVILIGGLQFFVGSSYVDRFQAIRDHEEYLKGVILRVVIAGIILFWLVSILRIFYLKDAVYGFVERLFTRDLSLGSMSFSLGKIVLFLFIIWFSIILSRVIKIVLRADVLDKLSLKKGVPRMVTAITQTALITFGVLFAIRAIGMPMDQLTIIFSAFSVGIGFGLQNIFNNLVSGVILLFERPVQIGDTVEVGNLIGKVQAMGIRSSQIHTFDGAEVIVPNGQLISQEVVNWTLSDKTRRIEVTSGVAYGSDVHQVRKLLLQVLQEHPDVIQSPPPLALFNAMGESSLDFRLLFWTDQFDEWLRIRSEVLFAVHDVLYANNISIPFPQRDLHLKSVDPSVFPNPKKNEPGDFP